MRAALICALLLLAVPAAAGAAWPVGGDAGRSGAAAEAVPGAPFRLAQRLVGEPVRTPLLITDAGAVAWGTAEAGGTVHLRALDGGAPVAAVDIAEEPSLMGQPPVIGGRLGFVSTSSGGRPGTLLVVHADGGALEVARIDERTGMRAMPDVQLPASRTATIGATPLLGPPDAAGTRALLFTTYSFEIEGPRLWRVPIRSAGSADETVDAGAAITRHMDPAQEVPLAMVPINGTDHVVVSNQNRLWTFSADALKPGPQSEAFGESSDRIDNVTVAADGAVFAVVGPRNDLVRLVAEGGNLRQVAERRLGVEPAGLAVSGGRLLVATGARVVALDSITLGPVGGADLEGSVPPAVAGELVFGARGRRPASSVAPLPDPDLGAVVGQPAVAGGAIAFPTEKGVAVYRGEGRAAAPATPPAARPRAAVRVRRLRGNRVRLTVTVAPCRPGRVRVTVRSRGRRRAVVVRVGPSCVARRVVRARRPVSASARYLP